MKLAQCIKDTGEFKTGEFVQYGTAPHSNDVVLITTRIKNYSPENLKNGAIIREDSGMAFGRILFDKHFKGMES
jgi:hypothetical protein